MTAQGPVAPILRVVPLANLVAPALRERGEGGGGEPAAEGPEAEERAAEEPSAEESAAEDAPRRRSVNLSDRTAEVLDRIERRLRAGGTLALAPGLPDAGPDVGPSPGATTAAPRPRPVVTFSNRDHLGR